MRMNYSWLFIVVILGGFFSGCTKEVSGPTENFQNDDTFKAPKRLVRVNDSAEIKIEYELLFRKTAVYNWSVDKGAITGNGKTALFRAPATPCSATVKVCVMDNGRCQYDSMSIIVYKQIIILKADDLLFSNNGLVSGRWVNFINMINKKKLKASIGLIGRCLENIDEKSQGRARKVVNNGRIEIWNHGYDHMVCRMDVNGNRFWEFKNTSLDHQREHLSKTQSLANQKLGIVLYSFGAPGNAFDENTRLALDEIDEIKVWFFGSEASNKCVLCRYGEIEFPTHYPDYKQFLANYNENRDYYVYQLHPDSWSQDRLAEFGRIVDFLKQNQCTFLTAFEFYQGNSLQIGG